MKPPKTPVWGSTVPGRSPEFKTHTQKNHAVCAIHQSYGWAYRQSGERIVWHFEDGEWKKVLAEMWENGRRHVV